MRYSIATVSYVIGAYRHEDLIDYILMIISITAKIVNRQQDIRDFVPTLCPIQYNFLDFPSFVSSSRTRKESPNRRVAGVYLIGDFEGEFIDTGDELGSTITVVSNKGMCFLKERLYLT